MRKRLCLLLSAVFVPAILIFSTGADHRDAPGVLNNQSTDINDVYAFVDPNDTSKVVLAMTVNGFSTPGNNFPFANSNQCLYQFKIDNDGDFVEDLVIQIQFDEATGAAFASTQNYFVTGPVKPAKVGAINSVAKLPKGQTAFKGPIHNIPVTANPATSGVPTTPTPFENYTSPGGSNPDIKVFCGLRDDAFTFDEVFVFNILRGTLAAPSPPNTAPQRSTPGIDFFAGLNCSDIVIELPSALLTGTLTNPKSGRKQINVWATTSVPTSVKRSIKQKKGEQPTGAEVGAKTYAQLDFMAHPAINTVLIDKPNKNAFNQSQPKDQADLFLAQAGPHIEALQLDKTSAAAIAAKANLLAIRFPDVLRLDVGSTNGFSDTDFTDPENPIDGNGRRPQDDVISYELGLLTVGAVTNEGIPGSDGKVGGNDVPLLTTFPFFAPPHVPREGVPKRD